MEYGVEIHGEPGIRRERIISADALALRMVNALLEHLHMQEGTAEQEVAVLINGFGATPLQELYLLSGQRAGWRETDRPCLSRNSPT